MIPQRASEAFAGGKQKKAVGSGLHEDLVDLSAWFLKASAEFPADDVAEVLSSHLMRRLADIMGSSAGVARCDFFSLPTQTFVGSRVFHDFSDLTTQRERDKDGKRSAIAFPDKFMGANPMTEANKAKLMERFTPQPGDTRAQVEDKSRLRQEFADLLAVNLAVGNWDVQPKNFGFYTGDDGKVHVGTIDFGWGLANMGAQGNVAKFSNSTFNIFDAKSMIGTRGTHVNAALPTNHFNDYPDMFRSHAQGQSQSAFEKTCHNPQIRNLAEHPEQIAELVNTALDETIDRHGPDDTARIQNYVLLAQHMHIKVEKYQGKTLPEIRAVVAQTVVDGMRSRFSYLSSWRPPERPPESPGLFGFRGFFGRSTASSASVASRSTQAPSLTQSVASSSARGSLMSSTGSAASSEGGRPSVSPTAVGGTGGSSFGSSFGSASGRSVEGGAAQARPASPPVDAAVSPRGGHAPALPSTSPRGAADGGVAAPPPPSVPKPRHGG
jgi:hypothetical protein